MSATFQEQIEEEESKKEAEKDQVGRKPEEHTIIKANGGENFLKEEVIDLSSPKITVFVCVC